MLSGRSTLVALVAAFISIGCTDTETAAETNPCTPYGEENPSFGVRNNAVFEQIEATADSAEDGPFYMLNFIKLRDNACYRDGRESDLTGTEANELYTALPHLTAIGAEPVFVGVVESDLLGDGVAWDWVAIVRYPSREAFLGMVADEAFQAELVHKDAGVEKSIVMLGDLRDSILPPGYMPGPSPYPATAEDLAIDIVHLLKYAEGGEEEMALYQQAAMDIALEVGVYPVACFDVLGVLVGDGRSWDELRINHMPSHAGFDAVVADPKRKAGEVHRNAALEDSYSVVAAPFIDALDPIAN